MFWEKVKLGEVCTIEKGNIGIMKAIPGEFPLVVLGEERKSHNEFQFDDEAVIIPLVSSTGHGHASMKRIFFQSGKFSVGSILCAVIPKDKSKLSAEFLYRYLDFNKEKELVSRMKGMANVSLPIKEIASVEIPLPPLEHQKKLINKFQKLETSNNQFTTELAHQLELVRQLRQAFLREAMQGKLVPQDEQDEPAESLLEKIKAEKEKLIAEKKIKKDKPLPEIKPEEIPFEIPKKWTWCRLGEIVSTIFDGPFGSHLKTADYTDRGVQVIRLENIGFMKFNIEKETFISEKKYQTISQHTVFENDVLISSFIADGVKTTLIPKLKYTAIAKADCFTLRTFDNWAIKKFIVFALSSQPIYDEFLQYSHGMTRLRINTTQLKKLMFPLPPLAEQKRIVEKLEKLMKYCDELEANIRTSKGQSESLLQVALKEALEPK